MHSTTWSKETITKFQISRYLKSSQKSHSGHKNKEKRGKELNRGNNKLVLLKKHRKNVFYTEF